MDGPPKLSRVLSLWDLVFYGIILITPIAPVGIFGVACQLSHGHAVTSILAAMIAMIFTAFSYGRMAALYPSGGSAYVYVGRELNPRLGFLAGWAMFLDYLMIPILNTIYVALTVGRLVPGIPYVVWVLMTASSITVLNLCGIRYTARTNQVLLAGMCVVIGLFFVQSTRFLFRLAGWSALFSAQPFYSPNTFDIHSLGTATSLAALTYVGFDGVTTLTEETKDPKRTVPLATMLVCLITGLLSALQVYLAQRSWPDYRTFSDLETAFLDVSGRVGGHTLFQGMAIVLIVACFGSGLTGQVSAARLLFSMGRDGVLPRKIFGHLDAKRSSPTYNLVLLGIVAFVGAMLLSYERAVALVNFGAFLSFMGVNIAAVKRCSGLPRSVGRFLTEVAPPACGFLFCGWIWLSLPRQAQFAGFGWLAVGLIYSMLRPKIFNTQSELVGFTEA